MEIQTEQILKTLMLLNKRMYDSRDAISFQSILEENKNEITFLKEQFQLNEVETLLFVLSCIRTIGYGDLYTNLDKIASHCNLSIFEILLHQKAIQSLIDKGFWEIEENQYYKEDKSSLMDIQRKDIYLNHSVHKYFTM